MGCTLRPGVLCRAAVRFLVRWCFRLLVLALLLALALVLLKDVLIEEYLETRFRRATGLELEIGRLEVALFSPVLHAENVRLYNPPEFGGAPALIAAEVHLEYDRAALWRGTLHLPLLRLHLAELVVVEDGRGGQNLSALAARWTALRHAEAPPLRFGGIDTLNLTVERVRRVNLRDPARNVSLDPALRGQIWQGLRSPAELQRVWTEVAARPALKTVLGSAPPAAENSSPRPGHSPR